MLILCDNITLRLSLVWLIPALHMNWRITGWFSGRGPNRTKELYSLMPVLLTKPAAGAKLLWLSVKPILPPRDW